MHRSQRRPEPGHSVRPKKYLGQHFLKDLSVAERTAGALGLHGAYRDVLEIGPGTGVLTRFLLHDTRFTTRVIEIDTESVEALRRDFPELRDHIIEGDFLTLDPSSLPKPFAITGNFPYNISSQILFRVLEWRHFVPELTGMFQKEVALRVASPPGSREYGILSVLLSAWYTVEKLFDVPPHVFYPPPRVMSAVVRLRRNGVEQLPCNEDLFFRVVKTAFNQRRKTLRNGLRGICPDAALLKNPVFDRRAETLGVDEFIELTQLFEQG
jgi:16S rRNA (adenine1518-N6/adenine1519-N6)-dimethyltransferase